ncbi:MAG: hypothetical protein JOY90_35885 [Bradyrhizobium sp.]|uniref:hypothetical protein n=1 Tax=Bradyrhizobium sp. TaxID=376 RepID=UPI001DB6F676|nr:hypothetical protein [Bradyrhizobium sp.]MBV9565797.1 hypothetical protein [Bradyrhizobium sp.]
MINAITAFMVAVAATSLVCLALMMRTDRRPQRRASRAGGDPYDGNYSSSPSNDGWSFASWSVQSSDTDSSGNPVADGGGQDSSSGSDGTAGDSGSDSGGGDGGGGGGGD